MAKKKKQKQTGVTDSDEVVLPKVPEKISRPFEGLSSFKLPKKGAAAVAKPKGTAAKPTKPATMSHAPKPSAPKTASPELAGYSYDDRVALRQAYAGVVRGRSEKATRPRAVPKGIDDSIEKRAVKLADDAARARLAGLVGDGVRFDVTKDRDGFVEGARTGSDPGPLRELKGGRAAPDAELDLHGMRADAAEGALVRFLREKRRGGARVVRIIHGKGSHSEGGVAVLAERVLTVLTEGDGAAHVLAFSSTAADRGGVGALLVRLDR